MSGLRAERAHDGAHLRLVLDRPKGNVVTADVIADLRSALATAKPGDGLKLISLEAAGPNFSYGASVEEHAADRIGQVLPALDAAVRDLLHAPAPTLAVVRGRCLGGGFELVLACDMVFAADGAVLGVPEWASASFRPPRPPSCRCAWAPRARHARSSAARRCPPRGGRPPA